MSNTVSEKLKVDRRVVESTEKLIKAYEEYNPETMKLIRWDTGYGVITFQTVGLEDCPLCVAAEDIVSDWSKDPSLEEDLQKAKERFGCEGNIDKDAADCYCIHTLATGKTCDYIDGAFRSTYVRMVKAKTPEEFASLAKVRAQELRYLLSKVEAR